MGAQKAPVASTRQARPPIRILLVDDNPEFLKSATQFLSAEPRIEIIGQALSGRNALEQMALWHPDLVLVDLAMPEMNGLDVTSRIKAQPGAPHVIILTLYDNLEYRAEARAVGADGFIAKSEFGEQLLSLIYRLFAADGGPSVGKED
jgi:DNA-binding NarL/FixJ family response regulator